MNKFPQIRISEDKLEKLSLLASGSNVSIRVFVDFLVDQAFEKGLQVRQSVSAIEATNTVPQQ